MEAAQRVYWPKFQFASRIISTPAPANGTAAGDCNQPVTCAQNNNAAAVASTTSAVASRTVSL